LFAVGILVGAMNAIAGGGMLLGFPVLLAVGMPPLAANITGNVVIGASTVSSVYGYRQYLRKLSRRYLFLLIPCAAGAATGALILRNTPGDEFQKIVPGLVGFAVILFAFQPLLHFHLNRHIKSKRKALRPLLIIALALLPVAIYGGYFGAGFGFVMLAFLGFTRLHEVHQMNGLKNVAGACIAFTALICLYSTHLVDWHYGLVMGAGCVIGGYYGATLTQKVSSHTLRAVVIIIGIGTAAYLALRTY
jgi:uncharacterized membrane protein YfcA